MASNFPTSLDNFTNPSSGNTLDSPSHSLQHSDINDAVEALEAKLGIGASPAGSATSGQVLTASTGGTTTWSTPTPGGLVQIVPTSVSVGSGSGSVSANGVVSFTNASSISINNVFSSTYSDYEAIIKFTSVSVDDLDVYMRLRTGITDAATNYKYERQYNTSTTIGSDRDVLGTTLWIVMNDADSALPNYNTISLKLFRPNLASPTVMHMQTIAEFSGGGLISQNIKGVHTTATAYESLNIYTSTGNVSGTVSFYGYR